MTSWTDLIDTDPVKAAKLYAEWLELPASKIGGMTVIGYEEHQERLIANLAALAESAIALTASLSPGKTMAEVQRYILTSAIKEDGSPRFPQVK